MASIIIDRGSDRGRIVLLENEAVTFGRSSDAIICFDDPNASRKHFSIEKLEAEYQLVDLNSHNGTYLNGEKISRRRLNFGDHIQAGSTLFSFVSNAETEERGGLFGKELGGYLIEKRLGRGGAGTVYLAKQLSMDRSVALKVLSPTRSSNPTFCENFVNEARAAGRLNHARVVQVYDVNQVEGHLFYSMEFMPGGSLGELLYHTDRLLPVGALNLLKDVASGLEYAEEKGIVHRDIKPENIMLDSRCGAKIGDLGIAISLGMDRLDPGLHGTPHYMSPEQARGEPVDQRSDIYSLGCTFYRLLSSQYPFAGPDQKTILDQQINKEPRPLTEFCEGIGKDLNRMILRMMAKKPERRYSSATALLQAVDECLELEARREKSNSGSLSKKGLTRLDLRSAENPVMLAETADRKIKILAVDDEPGVRTFVENIFSFFGCDVVTASNGQQGLKEFQSGGFDLVVTDRLMPGMNGDALSSAIKKIWAIRLPQVATRCWGRWWPPSEAITVVSPATSP